VRSFLARRVSRSSGKSELASHLVDGVEAPVFDVLFAFSKRLESGLVLEHVEGLFDGVPFFRGDDDRRGSTLARDHHMFVAGFDVVEEFGEMGACFGEGNDAWHTTSVQISALHMASADPRLGERALVSDTALSGRCME